MLFYDNAPKLFSYHPPLDVLFLPFTLRIRRDDWVLLKTSSPQLESKEVCNGIDERR
jgi:hypothetical protein